ncbi:hypothetical protein [Faecalispora sporosphaeroides]|uniref:hypothetical protein n=1 Tax=Faecalispora sporosphaeroides TaxID=1549 RepID=UPI0003720193|nr:hypothetical protein [Faecalispora sporosphaeroides]
MKRIISVLLCLLLFFSAFPTCVFAEVDGNIDNGGGGMGDGEAGKNFWNPGQDGVRITVVRASDNEPITTPIDLTNKNEDNIKGHFGKKSKLHYKHGASLVGTAVTYTYYVPKKGLPTIIEDNGVANIDEIRSYFTDKLVVRYIAQLTIAKSDDPTDINNAYKVLKNGNYKLLIEPIAYITFGGQRYAMTATEAALYDQKLSGGLRAKMKDLSHKNLPLAMFLRKADLGYPAYTGSRASAQSNNTIISSLGLGAVKFSEDDPEPEDPITANYTYRVNTDVVTSVQLNCGSEINPDSPAKVTFRINGSTYNVTNIVIPEDESQLVWVKWHTPSTPQTVNISVSSNKGSLSATSIAAKVENLDTHEPPNPTAKDRNDGFIATSVPNKPEYLSRSWGVWSARWHEYLVWHEHWVKRHHADGSVDWVDKGKWKDEGWWDWTFKKYTASLTAKMSLMPDDKAPTASGKVMKSGYGVKVSVTGDVDGSAPNSHITGLQTAVAYFPEFKYKSYWRLLDLTRSGNPSTLQFKTNKYSTYNRRVHFTPLWYPDGKYEVSVYAFDAWTPAGMLVANLSDYVTIKGNVYDDWHVGPKPVE